jgi:hypothetical protein
MPALGARAFEAHLCNFWPEWGRRRPATTRRSAA